VILAFHENEAGSVGNLSLIFMFSRLSLGGGNNARERLRAGI